MTPELKALRDTIEDALTHHLPVASEHAQILTDAMRYSVLSGGKRIRPLLVCATCTGLGGARLRGRVHPRLLAAARRSAGHGR